MRFISTKVHGVIDYLWSIVLLASPWLFGFANGGAETWVPVILGIGGIVYAVVTNYELGLVKVLPMPVHLMIDLAMGVFLLLSPWLFGFAENIAAPHVVLGIMAIGTSLMTEKEPRYLVKTSH